MADFNESTQAYIRPCGAFPDGYVIPRTKVPQLLALDLIEEDQCWQERETPPGDYCTVYDPFDDDEMERVADQIMMIVGR